MVDEKKQIEKICEKVGSKIRIKSGAMQYTYTVITAETEPEEPTEE